MKNKYPDIRGKYSLTIKHEGYIMNFLKNLALLSLFLCLNINNLNAAAAAEELAVPHHRKLLSAVKEGTQLPQAVCKNIIMPYLQDITPPLKKAWETPLPSLYFRAFVHQLPNQHMVAITKKGLVAHLNSANGALVKQSQLRGPNPLEVQHVTSLHGRRLALGLSSGDLSIVDLDNDGAPLELFPSGHQRITGLVCAMAKGKKELVVGGNAGIVTFDPKTSQRTTPFRSHSVSSMTLLPGKEKVAFNATPLEQPYGLGTVHVYDASTQEVRPTNMTLHRHVGQVATCGQRLMVMDFPPHAMLSTHSAKIYDPENNFAEVPTPPHDFKTHVNSAVTLPGAAAVLAGAPHLLRAGDPRGGWVTIVDENNQVLQQLPGENAYSSIAALKRGQLAAISAESPAHVNIGLWTPMAAQEAQEFAAQKKEANAEEEAHRAAVLAASAFGLRIP